MSRFISTAKRCLSHSQRKVGKSEVMMPTYSQLKSNVATWHLKYNKNEDGPLNSAEIEQYYEKGYLIKKNILSESMINECRNGCNDMVNRIEKDLYDAGLIDNLLDNNIHGFDNKLTELNKMYPGAVVLVHKYGYLHESWQKLFECSIFRDISFQLIQPESGILGAHPVWNIRPKIPVYEETTVPWHQDVGYLNEDGWNTHQLTAWIPLLGVNRINGCMEVISESHRLGNVGTHTNCWGNTWYIDINETTIKNELFDDINADINEKIVTCDINRGDVLFLNNMVVHRSLENYSNDIRWSLDLRWQDMNKPTGFNMKNILKIFDKNDIYYRPDWNEFNRNVRHLQEKDKVIDRENDDRFNTVIVGSWFDKWEMVNTNKHTNAWFKQD